MRRRKIGRTPVTPSGRVVASAQTPSRQWLPRAWDDLAKGATTPVISVREWTASAWSAAVVISGGSSPDALGSINTSTIPANETGGVSGGLTTALGQQDPFTFGEAAISFEALFGEGACGTFGSAYLKSRSSDSFTAEIKDFVPPEQVNISNCPSGLTTTATASVTIGSPISDTAHLVVQAGATGTITFHLFSDAACQNEVTTGVAGHGQRARRLQLRQLHAHGHRHLLLDGGVQR